MFQWNSNKYAIRKMVKKNSSFLNWVRVGKPEPSGRAANYDERQLHREREREIKRIIL